MATDRLIIVDGTSVLQRTPQLMPGEGRTARESRAKLLNLLTWAFGPGDVRFMVVFDGVDAPAAEEREEGDEGDVRIEVRCSRPPQTTDDVIRAVVEDQVRKVERLTVVTSDLEVARQARAKGADIALADLFIASVLGPAASETPDKPEPPPAISKQDLEAWAKLFRSPRPGEEQNDG